MDIKNVHDGHRERMTEKVINFSETLNDHELLEYLLYSAVPRKDTNALAHRLIGLFGSLKEVLNRSYGELISVDGVGKRVAAHIIALGETFRRVTKRKTATEKPEPWISVEKRKDTILSFFDGAEEEKFVLILLDEKFYEIKTLFFSNDERYSVYADSRVIRAEVNKLKIKNLIIAHNHISGNAAPSEQDDLTTLKFDIFCSANDVVLVDSLIVGGKNVYSYKNNNRLDKIKTTVDIEKLYNKFKEKLENE